MMLTKPESLDKLSFASLVVLMSDVRVKVKFSGLLNHQKGIRCIVTTTRRDVGAKDNLIPKEMARIELRLTGSHLIKQISISMRNIVEITTFRSFSSC
jgi:hypothetical protein